MIFSYKIFFWKIISIIATPFQFLYHSKENTQDLTIKSEIKENASIIFVTTWTSNFNSFAFSTYESIFSSSLTKKRDKSIQHSNIPFEYLPNNGVSERNEREASCFFFCKKKEKKRGCERKERDPWFWVEGIEAAKAEQMFSLEIL